jgi:5-methylcytosine-specific restriction endonuclease McrA
VTQFECETQETQEWQEVDRKLGAIAKQRAALDAEEARWLRAAARVKIWREVGCVSLLDYLERRLGYGPRAAQDRIRVALALEDLPELELELAGGMPYTAVRELTRVATRETEQEWIDACRGRTVHEVENAVSGHEKGSRPSDPAIPDLATRRLSFEEIKPTTIALLRQARQKAQDERGAHLSDDDLLALVLGAFIEGNGVTSPERAGRAKFQIAMVLCEQCDQGWQQGGGRRFAMEKGEVERAKCDAQYIGSLDGEPERATQDVPPRVRRFVFRRCGGRCSVPGCRSTRNLEIHHVRALSEGGSHDPANLILLCDSCHAAHHRGLIAISGTADDLTVKRKYEFEQTESDEPRAPTDEPRAHVGAPVQSRLERTTIRTQALDAGWLGQAHEARNAVDEALGHFSDARFTLESSASRAREVSTTAHRLTMTRRTVLRPVTEPAPAWAQRKSRAHGRTEACPRGAPRSRLERTTIRTQVLDAGRTRVWRHEASNAVDEGSRIRRCVVHAESFLRVALANSRDRAPVSDCRSVGGPGSPWSSVSCQFDVVQQHRADCGLRSVS